MSVLQYAEGLSDRQAADQVRARLDWKFLLGLELDDPGFDFTVLGDFRSRLIGTGWKSGPGCGAGAAVRCRAAARRRAAADDSTHVLAAVRTLNRMEFVGETLRAALEALAAAAPGWLAPLIDSGWADRYGARIDSYRFPKGEDARGQWAGQVGRDGFTLLDAVSATQAPAWLRQIPAVEALRRAWGQQYHRDEGGALAGGQRPPARRTAAGLPL